MRKFRQLAKLLERTQSKQAFSIYLGPYQTLVMVKPQVEECRPHPGNLLLFRIVNGSDLSKRQFKSSAAQSSHPFSIVSNIASAQPTGGDEQLIQGTSSIDLFIATPQPSNRYSETQAYRVRDFQSIESVSIYHYGLLAGRTGRAVDTLLFFWFCIAALP